MTIAASNCVICDAAMLVNGRFLDFFAAQSALHYHVAHVRRDAATGRDWRGRSASDRPSYCRWSTTSCGGWPRQKLAQEKPGQTLQATALVHEAYLRLVDGERRQQLGWPRPFLRRRGRSDAADSGRKRPPQGTLRSTAAICSASSWTSRTWRRPTPDDRLLAIDEALDRLAAEDPQAAELVKLRFFAGFSITEAAEILGMSRTSAYEQWAYARAWLRCEVERVPAD